MAEITAALVKELREQTGAGMMDCKKALRETDGDLDVATDWLRKNGLSAAAKKAGRVAAEGLVGVTVADGKGAVVEVNSETDFVARNDAFQDFVRQLGPLAIETGGDLDALKGAAYPGGERTVEAELTEMIATIGENMNLRRAATLSVDGGALASYVHNAAAPGLGKIGVLVALESDGDQSKLAAFGRQLAMHIAATNPQSVTVEALDQGVAAREREILKEQAIASGKPAEIAEKVVEGRLRKFFQDVVLLEQTFVIDNETTIAKAVEAAGTDAGGEIEVTGFVRFALGEGIERGEADFAAEVAELAG